MLCYYIVLVYCYNTRNNMQTTIYIRKENMSRWEEIKDKSAWVNEKLGTAPAGGTPRADLAVKVPVTTENLVSTSIITQPTPVKLCKIHGIELDPRGKCLQKGCKYA